MQKQALHSANRLARPKKELGDEMIARKVRSKRFSASRMKPVTPAFSIRQFRDRIMNRHLLKMIILLSL